MTPRWRRAGAPMTAPGSRAPHPTTPTGRPARSFLLCPTGRFPLGTTVWSVDDVTRPDIFDPPRSRQLTVQAWYPARAGAQGPREPYARDLEVFATILRYAHAPRHLLDRIVHTPTHAITNADPAPGVFPVVFFATGNMGYRGSNTIQVEDLASHGFVVITFDQPGTTGTALHADGHRVPYAGAGTVRPLVDASLTRAPATIPTHRGVAYPDGIATFLAGDPRVILDHLAGGDVPGLLAGHLDLERVGVFGVSLGGVTAAQWCADDSRVRACLLIDAPAVADVAVRGLSVPTAWLTRPAADMRAEGWPDIEIARYTKDQHAIFTRLPGPGWWLELHGRKHADLTDAPFGSPLPGLLGLCSRGTGTTTHEILRHITRDFFTHTLTGTPIDHLDTPAWPDLTSTHSP